MANLKDIYLLAIEIIPMPPAVRKQTVLRLSAPYFFRGVKSGKTESCFDLILFNPPYLPTSKDEKVPGWLNYAFDGGISGRETLDRFLDEVKDYLKPGGKILVLISSITGLGAVMEKMKGLGFKADIIERKKVSFEELMVIRGILS